LAKAAKAVHRFKKMMRKALTRRFERFCFLNLCIGCFVTSSRALSLMAGCWLAYALSVSVVGSNDFFKVRVRITVAYSGNIVHIGLPSHPSKFWGFGAPVEANCLLTNVSTSLG
jgi:hypothetical protein